MKRLLIGIFIIAFLPAISNAQDTVFKRIGINELFKMAVDSNQQLRVSRMGIDVANERVEVAKTLRNPNIGASASAFYLGDVTVFDKNLSNKMTVPMPHFGNSFALQASQMVFKGGAISNNIAIAGLQEQLASLNYQKNSMDVKLLLAGNYLDLFKMYNQRDVYQRNIKLAQLRISNINKMYKQGMVTRSDIIRTELLITNLNTAVQQIDNNIDILSQQLAVALGLPDNTYILPDTTILNGKPVLNSFYSGLDFAYNNSPDLKSAKLNSAIAEKGVAIAKADQLPVISLNAANSLARPITSSSPAKDRYGNGWQAGVGISYNLSSLYNSKKNIKLAKAQVAQQHEAEELQRQSIEVGVKAAYIKNREANQLLLSAEKSLELAQENYRIVEKKYLNQMAIITDLLDATNAKLDAELQQKNAEISIVYTYYQAQKAIGNL